MENIETNNIDKKINSEKLKVCVLGSGSFGTALATVASRKGHETIILSIEEKIVEEINNNRTNNTYFQDKYILPNNLNATLNAEEALNECHLIIHAVPVQYSVDYIKKIRNFIHDNTIYIIASKGILLQEKKFFSQIWDDLFPPERNIKHVILSGPSFAEELMKDYPTLLTAGCKDFSIAKKVQKYLSGRNLRIYTTNDVIGVEIGGALKNVLAIAAGIIEGLGYKFNTLSAVVTRGVFEISLLSKFYGGKKETLHGLSGIGDIMLSAFGDLSRNKKVGISLANGESIIDLLKNPKETAEGVPTLKVLYELMKENNIHMPICETTYKFAFEGMSVEEARNRLMMRHLEEEEELDLFHNDI